MFVVLAGSLAVGINKVKIALSCSSSWGANCSSGMAEQQHVSSSMTASQCGQLSGQLWGWCMRALLLLLSLAGCQHYLPACCFLLLLLNAPAVTLLQTLLPSSPQVAMC